MTFRKNKNECRMMFGPGGKKFCPASHYELAKCWKILERRDSISVDSIKPCVQKATARGNGSFYDQNHETFLNVQVINLSGQEGGGKK